MASPAFAPKTCDLSVNLFDGWRRPLQPEDKILLTVRDGNQKTVPLNEYQASTIDIKGLPFFDNFGDNYTVVAWCPGYEQAGFTPVKVSPQAPATLDIMLLKKDAGFDFSQARWGDLRQKLPAVATLLAAGAANEDAAAARYGDLVEKEPILACFFNLTTAMSRRDEAILNRHGFPGCAKTRQQFRPFQAVRPHRLRPLPSLARGRGVHPQTDRAAHGAGGESVDLGGSAAQPRMQTRAGVWGRGSRAAEP
jgi:hypothetical protein